MGKAIADPLFMFLVVAVAAQVLLYRDWRGLRRAGRLGLAVCTVATVALWLLGTHAAETYLVGRLSSVHPIPDKEAVADIDVVIVLSGGFVDVPPAAVDVPTTSDGAPAVQVVTLGTGAETLAAQAATPADAAKTSLAGATVAGPLAAYDQPDAWTTARVIQGVRTLYESDARLLVVSGRWARSGGSTADVGSSGAPTDDPARLVLAMKQLAVVLGVSPERVVVEPHARTTREHPLELMKLNIVGEDDTVGIVTSSWHLPRAMREFEKYFPRTVAVPAFDTAVDQKSRLLRWMPRSISLSSSATALAEYVGMIWYKIPLLIRR